MNNAWLLAIGAGFVASLLVTPPFKRIARSLGLVDDPDKERKLHRHPTPLCGGIAVAFGFLVSVATLAALDDSFASQLRDAGSFMVSLAISIVIICVTGMLDDRFELRGRQKLVGQILAAGVLTFGGVRIDQIEVFGVMLKLGPLAIPFSMFWLLGAINALNLLDGIDGLATTVGIIISLAITSMAVLTNHGLEAILAAGMAGALLGFLIYNFPPASVFLGDAGSMLIGLMMGVLAVRASFKGPATIALAAPLAVWAVPILDISMAIIRRKLTGRSIYTTDRGHLHHSLMHRGFSNLAALMVISGLCVMTAVAAVASVYAKSELLAASSVTAVVTVLVVARLFGHHEVVLLMQRVKHFAFTLVPTLGKPADDAHELVTTLRGTRQWHELWNTLTNYAERFNLCSIQLNIHMPAHGEDYHATWRRNGRLLDSRLWSTEIPLVANHLTVARLKLVGECRGSDSCTWIGDIISGLKPFEDDLMFLIEDAVNNPGPAAAPCFEPELAEPQTVR